MLLHYVCYSISAAPDSPAVGFGYGKPKESKAQWGGVAHPVQRQIAGTPLHHILSIPSLARVSCALAVSRCWTCHREHGRSSTVPKHTSWRSPWLSPGRLWVQASYLNILGGSMSLLLVLKNDLKSLVWPSHRFLPMEGNWTAAITTTNAATPDSLILLPGTYPLEMLEYVQRGTGLRILQHCL